MSLGCVEKCVRMFQQVGLLDSYSIQISSLLPLENFKPTRSFAQRPMSPQSSPEPEVAEDNMEENNDDKEEPINGNIDDDKALKSPEVEESLPDKENNVESKGKEENQTNNQCNKKRTSPNKVDSVRKDCNKPKFSEVNQQLIKDMELKTQSEIVSWLQETQFLSSCPPRCRGCGKTMQLLETPLELDGVTWKCPSKCSPGSVNPSLLREYSIFQFSKDKLLWILQIIMCWRDNTSLSQCNQVSAQIKGCPKILGMFLETK